MNPVIIFVIIASIYSHQYKSELPDVVVNKVIKTICKFERSSSGKFRQVKMIEVELKGPGQYTHLGDQLDYFIFDDSNNFVAKVTQQITEGIQKVPFNQMNSNSTYKIIVDLSVNNLHHSAFSGSDLKVFQIQDDPCVLQTKLYPLEYKLYKTKSSKKGKSY